MDWADLVHRPWGAFGLRPDTNTPPLTFWTLLGGGGSLGGSRGCRAGDPGAGQCGAGRYGAVWGSVGAGWFVGGGRGG